MSRGHKMLFLAGLALVLLSLAPPASAQYIFLDANGDGVHSDADVLPLGTTTTAEIRLRTDRNRDGSTAVCSVDGSVGMTINTYEVILRAFAGTITWGSFTNLMATATFPFGTVSDSLEFYIGFGGGEILPPGDYLLGRIELTPRSGSPSVVFANASRLYPPGYTSFGTACPGKDSDNTAKLGSDWHDSDGLAGLGGSVVPVLDPVADQTMREGQIRALRLAAVDGDGSLLQLAVTPELRFSQYAQTFLAPGFIEGELRLAPLWEDAGDYALTVEATDGENHAAQAFQVHVQDAPPPVIRDDPPIFSRIPPLGVEPGSVKEWAFSAYDPEGATVELALSSAPPFVSMRVVAYSPLGTSAVLRLAPAESDAGEWTVSLTASDQVRVSTQSVAVAVGPNHLPATSSADSFVLVEGDRAHSEVWASDADADFVRIEAVNPPRFYSVLAAVAGASEAVLSYLLQPQSGDAGGYTLAISVTDGIGRVELAIPIRVIASQVPGIAWTSSGIPCLELGNSVDLGVRAEVPAGGELVLVLSDAPEWITVSESPTNAIMLRLAPPLSASPGVFSLTVTAIDPAGRRSPRIFTGNLYEVGGCNECGPCLSVPGPPTAFAGPPQSGYVGVPVRFDGRWSPLGNASFANFNWSFGDGTSRGGRVVDHVFAAPGRYNVVLRVTTDGGTSRDTTEAIIAEAIVARAFTHPETRVLPLRETEAAVEVRVEPTDVPFDLADLRLESASLHASGLGECDSIGAIAAKLGRQGDSDQNGTPDVGVAFRIADIRRLLSSVRGKRDVDVRLEARTGAGVLVRGSLALHVIGSPATAVTVGPNPFNPTGSLRFDVASPARVCVRLYDFSGRLVRTLLDERSATPGPRIVAVDGRDASGRPLASGVYFFRVERGDRVDRGRVTLLK